MEFVKSLGKYKIVDHGCPSEERVDYPNFSEKVAKSVVQDKDSFGVLVCGTGIGIGIAANKVNGVRATVCHDYYSAV